MAFKLLSVALCLSAASALPQTLIHSAAPVASPAFFHAAAPTVFRSAAPTVFRSAAPTFVSHAAPTFVSHAAPATATVVRTAPAPAPAAVEVRTADPEPATESSYSAPEPAPASSYSAPAFVRTAPAAVIVGEEESEEIFVSPNYNFGYSVSDIESGDSKTQEEKREGDYVSGSYTVADPDGRIRLVTYTAGPDTGFQATVTYDGEPGPVAIPFNLPLEEEEEAPRAAYAAPAPTATVVRTAPAPATVVRTAPATATVVRTAPAPVFHALPAPVATHFTHF